MQNLISDTLKKVLIILLALCLIAFGIGFLFISKDNSYILFRSFPFYALGLVLGYLFSALRLFLIERSINKSLDMDKEGASGYARGQYMLRYFSTLIFFIIIAVFLTDALLGAFLPVLLTQPAAIIAGIKSREK